MSSQLNDSRKSRDYSIAIGLFAPAVIWFLHLFTASAVAEWGAISGLNQHRFLSISMVSWTIALVSLVAVAATLYSLLRVAHFNTQPRAALGNRNVSKTSEEFLGRVAIYSGVIFLVVTCAQTLPILLFLKSD